jgi:hypothetical protein
VAKLELKLEALVQVWLMCLIDILDPDLVKDVKEQIVSQIFSFHELLFGGHILINQVFRKSLLHYNIHRNLL